MATKEGEGEHAGRLHVRIVSYRQRLIDPDNLCPKYFIDCLRYAQIIPDDTAGAISLHIEQEKVILKTDQRTEITVERIT